MGLLRDMGSRFAGGYGWRGKSADIPDTVQAADVVRPTGAELAAQLLAEEYGEAPAAPSGYSIAILHGMQGRPIYAGTVPAHVVAKRRRRNKVARKTRRLSRLRAQ